MEPAPSTRRDALLSVVPTAALGACISQRSALLAGDIARWDEMKNEKALVRFGVVFLPLLGLLVSACGGPSTTFVTSWRSPKAEPLSLRGEPVAAVVMMQNDITRRSAEDALAREISHYGGK